MSLRKFLAITISTFFYVGYAPFIPGTFGSLAGLLVFFLVKDYQFSYIFVTLALIALGFMVSGEAEEIFNKKDARYIVIDEVCGMLLSLMFIPYDIRFVIIGFFLFRLFDVVKPYPAFGMQKLKGGVGVMADDIVAGIYTNIVLQVVWRFASFKTS